MSACTNFESYDDGANRPVCRHCGQLLHKHQPGEGAAPTDQWAIDCTAEVLRAKGYAYPERTATDLVRNLGVYLPASASPSVATPSEVALMDSMAAKVWEEAAKIADKGASGFLCGAADKIPKEEVTEIVNFAFRLLAKSFRDRAALSGGAPQDDGPMRNMTPEEAAEFEASKPRATPWAPQGEPPK